jgi:hypothetical protein
MATASVDTLTKPLGHRAYGSIPHLPGSRRGPADKGVNDGQARICTVAPRDKHDHIFIQEKLDGSCVSAAKINGQVVALSRAGWLATTSPYEQHHLWAHWVREHYSRFDALLNEGERVVGEWLAQAHGTRYELRHEPFVAFDLMTATERLPYLMFSDRVTDQGFGIPVMIGLGPISITEALERLGLYGQHGAIDPIEGAMWRVERNGKVDFLAKYVRPGKQDGIYLPEMSGQPAVWNWRPSKREAS